MKPRRPRPAPATAPTGLSRRRFLGGALAATLAAAVLSSDRVPRPAPRKPIWIGHC